MTSWNGGGNDDGFEAIFRKYYRRVWLYFRACRASDDDAHDYAQETFKRFWERRHLLRGESPFPLIQTIARNVLLNKLRDQKAIKRSAKLVELDDPEVGDVPAPQGPDYAERQQQETRRRDLYQAMKELPEGQRRCLGLWLGGYQYDEISKELEISLDAVRSRLRDARRQLRARLGADALPEDEQ
jgi:RNA polymerase sigma factor (sigma-70 family)